MCQKISILSVVLLALGFSGSAQATPPQFDITDEESDSWGLGYLSEVAAGPQAGTQWLRFGESSACKLVSDPIEQLDKLRTQMTVIYKDKNHTLYAAYQPAVVTEFSMNGALMWNKDKGVEPNAGALLTGWATHALGNDPWHAQLLYDFCQCKTFRFIHCEGADL